MTKELREPKPVKMICGYRSNDRNTLNTSVPYFSIEELLARSEAQTEVLRRIMRFPLPQPKH